MRLHIGGLTEARRLDDCPGVLEARRGVHRVGRAAVLDPKRVVVDGVLAAISHEAVRGAISDPHLAGDGRLQSDHYQLRSSQLTLQPYTVGAGGVGDEDGAVVDEAG